MLDQHFRRVRVQPENRHSICRTEIGDHSKHCLTQGNFKWHRVYFAIIFGATAIVAFVKLLSNYC
jgi:hypothetical protein